MLRMSPLENGRVSYEAFHRFARSAPRQIGELERILERDILHDLIKCYRRAHSIKKQKASQTQEDRSVVSQEDVAKRDAEFHSMVEELVEFTNEDDQGMTTVENLLEGILKTLPSLTGDPLTEGDIVNIAQYVGADDSFTNLIHANSFFLGICKAIVDHKQEQGIDKFSDMYALLGTDRSEALNLICEDLQEMIRQEAKDDGGTKYSIHRRLICYIGQYDFRKPFELFDENGDGEIPRDEFRVMLKRLNVDTLLEEDDIDELLQRFDPSGTGRITLNDFQKFTETNVIDFPQVLMNSHQRSSAFKPFLTNMSPKAKATPRITATGNKDRSAIDMLQKKIIDAVSVKFGHSEMGLRQVTLLSIMDDDLTCYFCHSSFSLSSMSTT